MTSQVERVTTKRAVNFLFLTCALFTTSSPISATPPVSPMLEMHFSEGSGTTTVDESGNGNNGTLASGVTWTTDGKFGNALSFDNLTEYVDVPAGQLDVSSISVSMWIKPNWVRDPVPGNSSSSPYFFDYSPDPWDNAIWLWAWTHYSLNCMTRSGGTGNNGTGYDAGWALDSTWDTARWHHVACVWDQTDGVQLYVDGVLRGSNPTYVPITGSASNFKIGKRADNDSIDEVHIYNWALTAEEIAELAAPQVPPIAILNFDEGVGQTAADTSGYGNHATLSPGVIWTTDGISGNALSFDEYWTDYVDVPAPELDVSSVSVSMWVKPNWVRDPVPGNQNPSPSYFDYSPDYWDNAIWLWDWTHYGLHCMTRSGGTGDNNGAGYDAGWAYDSTWDTAQWHHVVCIWDETQGVQLYVDGTLRGSNPTYVPISGSLPNFNIGKWADNDSIDEVRVYNRALTQAEIAALSIPPSSISPPRNSDEPSPTPLLSVQGHNLPYFSDPDGNAVYLSGAHVWQNVQEYGPAPPPTDCGGHSCGEQEWEYLRARGHNFTRGWHWEQEAGINGKSGWTIAPGVPFLKVDGRYDLCQYDPVYFARLRERVSKARDQDLYISVMLFQGHSVQDRQGVGDNPWLHHPFHPDNNSTLMGLDPDKPDPDKPAEDGGGEEIHTLRFPEVTALQKAYIERVIQELNSFDNVIWEICNECGDSLPSVNVMAEEVVDWMEAMANHIKQLEGTPKYPIEHLVWMSPLYRDNVNTRLLASPYADVVSLRDSVYQSAPPPHDISSGKVVLLDSDHIGQPVCLDSARYGMGWCDSGWPWKAFTRGYNPVFMDTVRTLFPARLEQEDDTDGDGVFDDPDNLVEKERLALGQTVSYANEIIRNLGDMEPRGDLSTTGYCLAAPGSEYLVFQPEAGNFSVELEADQYYFEWFDTQADGGAGTVVDYGWITPESGSREFSPPAGGERWVLYLVQQDAPSCQPDFDTLCFADGRFAVTAAWTNQWNGDGGTAHATPHPTSDATGYFWFFEQPNLEIGVKILDGGPVNNNYWLYHGAMTTFHYSLTVHDLHLRDVKVYDKQTGLLCGGADTTTFPKSLSRGEQQGLAAGGGWPEGLEATAAKAPTTKGGTCTPGTYQLCLMGNRFKVEVKRDAIPQNVLGLTDQAGEAYFFSPENIEVIVKMFDAASIDGKFWVFVGSMTEGVNFRVVVTDTTDATVRNYYPSGPLCGVVDTGAFDSP